MQSPKLSLGYQFDQDDGGNKENITNLIDHYCNEKRMEPYCFRIIILRSDSNSINGSLVVVSKHHLNIAKPCFISLKNTSTTIHQSIPKVATTSLSQVILTYTNNAMINYVFHSNYCKVQEAKYAPNDSVHPSVCLSPASLSCILSCLT